MPFKRAALLFLVAFSVRVAVIGSRAIDPLMPDSYDYVRIGVHLAQGQGFTIDGTAPTLRRPPLYPLFVSCFFRLAGGRIEPVLGAQAVVDSLSTIWVALIAAAFMAWGPALACGLIYALHPLFVGMSAYLLSETLFFNLWLLFTVVIVRAAKREKASLYAMAGLLLGAAVLCRPAHQFYALGLLPLLSLGGAWRRRAALWAVFFICFLSTLAPWAVRNRLRFHSWTSVSGDAGHAWWIGSLEHYPYDFQETLAARPQGDFNSADGDRHFRELAIRNWSSNWPRLLSLMPYRLAKFWITSHCGIFRINLTNQEYFTAHRWLPLAFKGALLILQSVTLAFGLWGAWRLRRRWREQLLLGGPILYASLHITNDWAIPRYHLSALPFFWILGAWALSERRSTESLPWAASK